MWVGAILFLYFLDQIFGGKSVYIMFINSNKLGGDGEGEEMIVWY